MIKEESGLMTFDVQTRNRILEIMDFLWNNKYTTDELIEILGNSSLLNDKSLKIIKSCTREDGSNFLIYNDKVTIMEQFIQEVAYLCANNEEDYYYIGTNESGEIYYGKSPIWIIADIIKFTPSCLESQKGVDCAALMNKIVDILNIRITVAKKCTYLLECIDFEEDAELKSMIDGVIVNNYVLDDPEKLQQLCNKIQQEAINYTVARILKK